MTALTLEALTKIFPRGGREAQARQDGSTAQTASLKVVDSVDLKIHDGEFFTLLGPSGCGKSTTLRMIAGFEEPTSGRILFDKTDVTFDPPNRRDIGFVFQNYALFPHLTVARNVGFGLQVRKLPREEVRQRVKAALEEVQLGGFEEARVDRLSGGQQQRVALARALVIRPRLLLLDEPLSNLDAKLRQETRAALRLLHQSTRVTTIYVTHDQDEAMAMSDRIAVMHRGRIHQVGVPEDVYERPATRFVADFIGRNNVLDGSVVSVSGQAIKVRLADGAELAVDADRRAAGIELKPGSRVGVCLRAESLRFATEDGLLSGVITDVEYAGPVRSYIVETSVGKLKVETPSSTVRPVAGETVQLSVAGSAVHLVAAQ